MFYLRLFTLCLAIMFPLTAMAEPNIIKSIDGELQLVLPEGWEQSTSHSAETEIAAMHRASHSNAIVISIMKADFAGNLKKFAQKSVHSTTTVLVDANATDGKSLQVNGHDAIQYEIHGTLLKAGLKIAYLETFIELDKHLVQVSGWTTESRFVKDRANLEKLAGAISEVN